MPFHLYNMKAVALYAAGKSLSLPSNAEVLHCRETESHQSGASFFQVLTSGRYYNESSNVGY